MLWYRGSWCYFCLCIALIVCVADCVVACGGFAGLLLVYGLSFGLVLVGRLGVGVAVLVCVGWFGVVFRVFVISQVGLTV